MKHEPVFRVHFINRCTQVYDVRMTNKDSILVELKYLRGKDYAEVIFPDEIIKMLSKKAKLKMTVVDGVIEIK